MTQKKLNIIAASITLILLSAIVAIILGAVAAVSALPPKVVEYYILIPITLGLLAIGIWRISLTVKSILEDTFETIEQDKKDTRAKRILEKLKVFEKTPSTTTESQNMQE
jgi:hypothetical protein